MRALLNCLTTVVSLCCVDDDDCDFTNDDITVGKWVIRDDTVSESVASAAPAPLPHQVMSWEYLDITTGEWESDPQLTVTGNININILCLNIDISL